MQCLEASEWMSIRLDGELTESEVKVLDEHLATCASCRAEWDAMQRTAALFSNVSFAAPSPLFTEKVMTRVQRRTSRFMILRGMTTLLLGIIVLVAVVMVPLRALLLTDIIPLNPAIVSAITGFCTTAIDVSEALFRAGQLILAALFSGSNWLILLGYLMLAGGLVLCWLHLIVWPERASLSISSTASSPQA